MSPYAWAALAVMAIVAVSLGLAVIGAVRRGGADAQRAAEEKQNAEAARKQLADARKAEEVRRATDTGDFDSAVDKL